MDQRNNHRLPSHRQRWPSLYKPTKYCLPIGLLTSVLVGLLSCRPSPQAPLSTQASPAELENTEQLESGATSEQLSAQDLKPDSTDESAIAPDNPDADNIDCDNANTQLDLNLCAAAERQQAEADRAATYQTLANTLGEQEKQTLALAESAWQTFRDRDCEFAASRFEGGSIAPMVFNDCAAHRTATRAQELQGSGVPDVSYEAADAELNQVYQTLIDALPAPVVETLITAQIAWIDYRDRNCAFEIIERPDIISESQCLARMSTTRTKQLQITLDDQNSR